MPTSTSFQEYAWFSVQVDQYYVAIRVFARHYKSLKTAYSHIPKNEDWPRDFTCLTDSAKQFFVVASSSLNYMGTTQIFADAPYPELRELPKDIINFGFYTCFCFQWTLFENFVKKAVLDLVIDDLLPSNIASELRTRELRTRAFLKYIDEGQVFGHSPFTTVLPVVGWVPQFEKCDFHDLEVIREQRNRFTHAVESPSILPTSEMEKEKLYQRSMWIMRQFAGNVDQDVQKIRSNR